LLNGRADVDLSMRFSIDLSNAESVTIWATSTVVFRRSEAGLSRFGLIDGSGRTRLRKFGSWSWARRHIDRRIELPAGK
jgi:hypothetical protein